MLARVEQERLESLKYDRATIYIKCVEDNEDTKSENDSEVRIWKFDEEGVEVGRKLSFDLERASNGWIFVNGLGAESPLGPWLLEPVHHRFRLMSVDKEIGPVLVHLDDNNRHYVFDLKATAAASSLFPFFFFFFPFFCFFFSRLDIARVEEGRLRRKVYAISRRLNGFFLREDACEETEAGEHEAVEDQAELEGIPRAQSFLGDHVEGVETDGECFFLFINTDQMISRNARSGSSQLIKRG